MMNQEIKAKWVAALRSGEYTQIHGSLKTNNGHCCLGVLCEVIEKEIGVGVEHNMIENRQCHNLGDTIMRTAGLTIRYGDRVRIGMRFEVLSTHNDAGRSFRQIANAIEDQL